MMGSKNNDRWSIFIDVEGFSFLHKTSEFEAHRRLNNLIEDIYKIGTQIYPDDPDRLFVHQLGDGFVIVSSFAEETLYRPLSIALALMQSALLKGGICKAGISDGNFADVQGTWPKEIRDNIESSATLRIGEGVMKLFTVMGDALINSYKALSLSGSGPHLVIDNRIKCLMPPDIRIMKESEHLLFTNWLNLNTSLSNDILEILGHENINHKEIYNQFEVYIQENKASEEWKANANKYLENG